MKDNSNSLYTLIHSMSRSCAAPHRDPSKHHDDDDDEEATMMTTIKLMMMNRLRSITRLYFDCLQFVNKRGLLAFWTHFLLFVKLLSQHLRNNPPKKKAETK